MSNIHESQTFINTHSALHARTHTHAQTHTVQAHDMPESSEGCLTEKKKHRFVPRKLRYPPKKLRFQVLKILAFGGGVIRGRKV